MIVEQQLEKQVIAAIRDQELDAVYYSGVWSEAECGTVKGDEGEAAAVVAVTVSPRTMESYSGGVPYSPADIGVTVSCIVGSETDPTGALLLRLYDRVSVKVWEWVKDATASQQTELTVRDADGETVFAPGGVRQDGGQAPLFGGNAWSWSLSFTIRGIIYK